MLRAARFVAQLDVEAPPAGDTAISAMCERLAIVSAERIRDELDKLLVADPVEGSRVARGPGLADTFLPELAALELEQDPVHQHKDVLRHTYAVVASDASPTSVLRLAALLHDIGKPSTRQITPEGVQFHHHEVVGSRMADERLRELRYPEPRRRRRAQARSRCTCGSTDTARGGATPPCGGTCATPVRCSTR